MIGNTTGTFWWLCLWSILSISFWIKEIMSMNLEPGYPPKKILFPGTISSHSSKHSFLPHIFFDVSYIHTCPRKGNVAWQWTTWLLIFLLFSPKGVEKIKRNKLSGKKVMLTYLFLRKWQSIFLKCFLKCCLDQCLGSFGPAITQYLRLDKL